MKAFFYTITLLRLVTVVSHAAALPAPKEGESTELAASQSTALFKFNKHVQSNFVEPKSSVDLLNIYIARPIYAAVGEFVSNFPYEAAQNIKDHRYLNFEQLKNFTFAKGNARKVLGSVVSVPSKDLAIMEEFLEDYLDGVIEHGQKHFNIFMLALRHFLSSQFSSLAWMKPSDGLTFAQ